MKDKKKLNLILGICFIAIILMIGVSYALWQITLQQESTNVIKTGCIRVEFADKNPISLLDAYPISDEEGRELTPYTFTITNTCDSYASYQINLEVLNDTTLEDLSFLKVGFQEKESPIFPRNFSNYEVVSKTLETAKESYKLNVGYLNAKESKSFGLRLWLDENTPLEETYMNKSFLSKITVIATFLPEIDAESPEVSFTTMSTDSEVTIDASASSDNNGISTYYYSIDGKNWIPSKNSSYTFQKKPLEYGIATDTISNLYTSNVNEVYVRAEDALGNVGEKKILLEN